MLIRNTQLLVTQISGSWDSEWDTVSCNLIDVKWRFRVAYCLHYRLDWGSNHLWNVGILQRQHMALYPRRPSPSHLVICSYSTGRSIISYGKHLRKPFFTVTFGWLNDSLIDTESFKVNLSQVCKGFWLWFINYANIMLYIIHCQIYIWHTVRFGSWVTAVFRWVVGTIRICLILSFHLQY